MDKFSAYALGIRLGRKLPRRLEFDKLSSLPTTGTLGLRTGVLKPPPKPAPKPAGLGAGLPGDPGKLKSTMQAQRGLPPMRGM